MVAGTGDTVASGINNEGQIVGSYQTSTGQTHGFLYNPNDGSYTTLDVPSVPVGTSPSGINPLALLSKNLAGYRF